VRKVNVKNLSDFERAKIFVENLIIGEYKFDKYLSKKDGRISEILVFGKFNKDEKKIIKEAEIVADSVNLARNFANEPGGSMTPTILANEVKKLFKNEKKVKVKILEEAETKKLGMGLFNSVGAGSAEKSKFIIVEYKGGKSNEKPIVLVGKGVTFDTGGTNLKPGDGLLGMNMDMTGGAVVISAFQALVKMEVKKNLIILVPAVENSISGSATRPGDIIKSLSDKTVQINNTDAEGRLILADAITYAKKYKPETLIDVATLTGAALMAVGQRASVVISNDTDLENKIRETGEKVGDYF
jgi:leucyl aminopeptidase